MGKYNPQGASCQVLRSWKDAVVFLAQSSFRQVTIWIHCYIFRCPRPRTTQKNPRATRRCVFSSSGNVQGPPGARVRWSPSSQVTQVPHPLPDAACPAPSCAGWVAPVACCGLVKKSGIRQSATGLHVFYRSRQVCSIRAAWLHFSLFAVVPSENMLKFTEVPVLSIT